ncbi:MAG: hypothetical protein ACM35H_13895 [Bacteroidota bacterium]|nr:hypothetical protein [Kiloniellaceae bacterium]
MLPQISLFPLPLRTISLSLSLPVVALATVFAATPCDASEWDLKKARVTKLVPSQLVVESNGSSYHSVSPFANIVADVRVQIDTGYVGHVKSWKVWLGLAVENGAAENYPHYNVAKSYPWYDRPRSVDRTETVIVPAAAWDDFVKARCNALADGLRAQGLGNTAIFGQDRKIELAVIPFLDADNTGAGSGSIMEEAVGWASERKVELVCRKWAGAAIPQASDSLAPVPAKVVNKGLSIYEQATLNGSCKIRLDGWVTTDQKHAKVSFRYRNQAGKQSQVWTVNTGESKTANFSHWYDIPNTEWTETGSVRIVGVSHDFETAWAQYSMDCVEGGPQTLAANDPPALKMTLVEQGKVMVHGRICPERLKLVGLLEGRGNFSGYAGFVKKAGKPWLSPPRAYSIAPGEKVLIGADYPLDWSETPAPEAGEAIRSDPRFDFNVTNSDDKIIASLKNQMRLVVCKPPALNPVVGGGQGELAIEPRQPAAPAVGPRRLQQQVAPTPQLRLLPAK